MDPGILTALTNFGLGGLVVAAVLCGWLVPGWAYRRLQDENKALRQQAATDRQRGDEATEAGRVTNALIGAIRDMAAERARAAPEPRGPLEGLTWKDLT